MDTFNEYTAKLKLLAEENKDWTYAFAAIGVAWAGIKLGKGLCSTYKYLLRPSYDLATRYGKNWAVVSGASDGIGKALAIELAKRGFKVGLIGRNKDKLDKVATEIESVHKVETKVVVFDFNVHYTDEKIQELKEKLDVFDIVSILINNVGGADYDPLVKMKDSEIHKMLNINVVGTTVMTKLMIPKLLLNPTRAGILFIGSSSAVSGPCSNLAVYSASKSYVHQFAESINGEHSDKIDVTVSSTSSVKTNMNSGRYLFTITPEQHASHVLSKLGHDLRTHGHTKHALGHFLKQTYGSSSIISYINAQRRKQFLAERNR